MRNLYSRNNKKKHFTILITNAFIAQSCVKRSEEQQSVEWNTGDHECIAAVRQ